MADLATSIDLRVRSLKQPSSAEPAYHEGLFKLGSFNLGSGAVLRNVQVAYTCVGPVQAPVVAVLGGISAHRRVAATSSSSPQGAAKTARKPEAAGAASGWWEAQVGPGRAIDTRRCRVLCWDYLGGNGATTGARCGDYADAAFPDVTTEDQARLCGVLLTHLGIANLHAFIGASYGGMVALQFAALFPQCLDRAIVISAAHKNAPMAVAWRTLQRKLVEQSLANGDGLEGLALARALAMATYRTAAEFSERFAGDAPSVDPDQSAVWSYLSARGEAYTQQMHPRAFLCLSRSIDLHHLAGGAVRTPLHLVAVRQDQLVPHQLIAELARESGPLTTLATIDSLYGHDAFLKETAQVQAILASIQEVSRD